jgi:hypothetical protein
MIPPRAINHVYVSLVFDQPVLNKGPPYRIESAPGHTVELFYTLFVPLVQILDDTEQAASMTIRRELAVVLLCNDKISARVCFSGRRGVHSRDPNTTLCEIGPEVLPVSVIPILEEQDRVDDVTSEQQRLVCGNGGRDAAEPRIANEDRREEEGSVTV